MLRLPAARTRTHAHTHTDYCYPKSIQTFSCRFLNTKLKCVLYVSSVYILLPFISPHYRYTKHTAPSAVKTVIDGENYLCFSLCLSTSLITSFHHITLAGDVSFSPLTAKILSITFASHCYNRRTSLFPLRYLNVILNTQQPLLSLEEWILSIICCNTFTFVSEMDEPVSKLASLVNCMRVGTCSENNTITLVRCTEFDISWNITQYVIEIFLSSQRNKHS
jgi:hypothetical protein